MNLMELYLIWSLTLLKNYIEESKKKKGALDVTFVALDRMGTGCYRQLCGFFTC